MLEPSFVYFVAYALLIFLSTVFLNAKVVDRLEFNHVIICMF